MHCAKNIIGVDTRDWILSAGQLTEKKWRTCQLLRRDLCVLALRRRTEKAANNEPTWVEWFAGQVGEKGLGSLWSAALLGIGTLGNDRGGRGEVLPDNDNFVHSARRTLNKLIYSWEQGHKFWDKRIDTRWLSNIRAEYWRTPTWITVKVSLAIDRLSLVWVWRYWVRLMAAQFHLDWLYWHLLPAIEWKSHPWCCSLLPKHEDGTCRAWHGALPRKRSNSCDWWEIFQILGKLPSQGYLVLFELEGLAEATGGVTTLSCGSEEVAGPLM